MLYVGNFSYTDEDDGADNICLMPALVEAPHADAALERFAELIHSLHEETDLFDGAKSIYLDSFVEFDSSPTDAVAVQWQKVFRSDDGLYSVLTPLPTGEGEGAYAWSSEEEVVEIDPDAPAEELAEAIVGSFDFIDSEDDEEEEEEAFITFK